MNKRVARIFAVFGMAFVAAACVYVAVKASSEGCRNIALGVLASLIASFVFYLLTEFVFSDESVKANVEALTKTDVMLKSDATVADIRSGVNSLTNDMAVVQRQVTALNRYGEKGLERIELIEAADTENDLWLDLLDRAENNLDIIAHTLSPWFREKYKAAFCRRITKIANTGGHVRLLLLDPDRLQQINSSDPERYRDKIRQSLKDVAEIRAGIDPDKRGNLTVKLNSTSVIPYSYIRNDTSVYVSPYLCSSDGRSSFIAVCKLDKPLARGFIKDFEDVFMDARMRETDMDAIGDAEQTAEQIDKKETFGNRYQSRTWDREDTTRYVFRVGERHVEAGFYLHYMGDGLVEKVIELSTSYGCHYRCKYCASSQITAAVPLKAGALMDIFCRICLDKDVGESDPFTLAMTGTGDYSITFQETGAFLEQVRQSYPNCRVILSSCAWTPELIGKATGLLDRGVAVQFLQWTYISAEDESRVIPHFPQKVDMLKFGEVIAQAVRNDERLKHAFRINYLMIRDVNDSEEAFDRFAGLLEPVKEHVLVRVSKLNETSCSRMNKLYPPEQAALEKLRETCRLHGIEAYIFMAAKNDNMNCGQLLEDL